MALGRDEERTIIVELGRVKSFSDIHGRHVHGHREDRLGSEYGHAERDRNVPEA